MSELVLGVQGIEAALYAALMSVSNLGSTVAGLAAAGLMPLLGITDFKLLWMLILLLILPNLLSLLFLPHLPAAALKVETDDKRQSNFTEQEV